MPHLILICFSAAMLTACAAQSSDAIKSSWAQEQLACADLGIDPGSPIFGQCVAELHQSIWAADNENLGN
jgi:hypothetical protein